MVDIETLDDQQLVSLINARWTSEESLWSKVKSTYESSKRVWQNNPEWLDKAPKKMSRARDNRIFIDTESLIATLTARPSKPNVIPANDSKESSTIANNLQDFFLAKYRDLRTKDEMRRALRYLFFSRVFCLKPFWDTETDDFDVKAVNPTKIKFGKNKDWFIEEVEEDALQMIYKFPDKEKKIINKTGGGSKEDLYIKNLKLTYKEAWIGDWVIYEYQGEILKKEKDPYWDWDGVKMIDSEQKELEGKSGQRRRGAMSKIKGFQQYRGKATDEAGKEYQSYLYNHFDEPRPPYIMATLFAEEDERVGETSLIEQANPLQEEVDKRKRQFSDNAEMMNGIFKIDTEFTKISKADALRAKANPRGIWYGKGVARGVTRETGKDLPSFLKEDLFHSIAEIDAIFGTSPTFRGEQGQQETATGRAILREQSFQRQTEFIELVDKVHEELYNWEFQFMKVRYTEAHLTKPIGATKASEVIELTQDDLEEGIEIKIIPGQILPEDRLYRAERVSEDAKAGLVDPLSYFEAMEYDNPMEQAKRLALYQVNPFSIIDLDEEDLAKLQKAMEMFPPPTEEGEGGGEDQAKAQQISEVRQQAEAMINSEEFKQLPVEQQQEAMKQLAGQLQNLTSAKSAK